MNYLKIWLHKVPFIKADESLAIAWNLAEFDIMREAINYSDSKILPELLFHESLHAMIHFMGLGTPDPGIVRTTNICNMLANSLLTSSVVIDDKENKLSQHFDAVFAKAIKNKHLEVKIANRFFNLIYDDSLGWDIYKIEATQQWMDMTVSEDCVRPQIWWLTGILEQVAFSWWIYTRDKKEKFQEEQFVRVMTQAILPYVERHFIF